MARKKAKRSPSRKRKKGSGPLLTREQQRDVLGVALLALAVFVAASLLPTSWLGERAAAWFPSGNVVGMLGAGLRTALVGIVGGAAPLVAVLLAVAGLRAGDWLDAALSLIHI